VRIAVDAMGGDHAPDAPVAGAVHAVRDAADLEVILVGPAARVGPALEAYGGHPRVHVMDRPDVIETGEAPVAAVRGKPQSSLVQAIQLVKEGQADGAVSAGNTGAMMAAGLLVLGRVAGVERPALSAVLPGRRPPGVLLLDVGANLDAKPPHLVQYAWMGSVYAEEVLGIRHPRVGLLNIGTEPGKGPSLLQEVHGRLSLDHALNFVGNVESREVMTGAVDVLVSDGFVGNILLKAVEGTAEELLGRLRQALRSTWRARLGALLALPALGRLARQLDYQEVGGVPLLGLDGVVIKAHGSSRPRAFQNSIQRAREQAERGVTALIRDVMGRALGSSEEAP
jgi:glycerol-3-phosphate acyltransferase PlsX